MISTIHILGVVLTVGLLLMVSWWSGRRVKDAGSFITGGTSGTWLVGGALLGVATILVRDVYGNLRRNAPRLSQLAQIRLSIAGVLLVAVVVALLCNNTFINDLGFLSLGLRAVSLLFPLSFALWLPARFAPRRILLAMPVGVAAMLAAKFLALPGDAVYYGLALELLAISAGTISSSAKNY